MLNRSAFNAHVLVKTSKMKTSALNETDVELRGATSKKIYILTYGMKIALLN